MGFLHFSVLDLLDISHCFVSKPNLILISLSASYRVVGADSPEFHHVSFSLAMANMHADGARTTASFVTHSVCSHKSIEFGECCARSGHQRHLSGSPTPPCIRDCHT